MQFVMLQRLPTVLRALCLGLLISWHVQTVMSTNSFVKQSVHTSKAQQGHQSSV